MENLPDHIRSKIFVTSCGCWVWTGELSGSGYGRAWYNGIRVAAHRVVRGVLTGKWHEGKVLDHKCLTRCCVNPAHNHPVTQLQNSRLRDQRNT